MARPKRKRITIAVTLSVRRGITAAMARREVKTLINEHGGYYSFIEDGDVRAISVRPLRTETRNG